MRTALILLGGFALWGICLLAGKLLEGVSSATVATGAFIVIWFAIAAGNMWVGVHHAGYSLSEELPIFFLIFLPPVIAAIFVKLKFL